MTKTELLRRIEGIPDDAEIYVAGIEDTCHSYELYKTVFEPLADAYLSELNGQDVIILES